MIEPRDVDRFRRELHALVAKADDPEGFAQAVALADELTAALTTRANELRHPVGHQRGFSWADLAGPLGLTRQGCAQRYGSPAPAHGRPSSVNGALTERRAS